MTMGIGTCKSNWNYPMRPGCAPARSHIVSKSSKFVPYPLLALALPTQSALGSARSVAVPARPRSVRVSYDDKLGSTYSYRTNAINSSA